MRRPLAPPVYALTALIAEAVLARLDFGLPMLPSSVRILGVGLLAAGVAVATVAKRSFQRGRTAVSPFADSTILITSGPYRVTRNPMYLGMVAMVAGVGLTTGSPAALFVPVVLAVVLDVRFIRMEERALGARFGETYDVFAGRVRRWL